MNYTHLREILAHHQAYDQKERADMEHINALLEQQHNLLTRECQVAHITGSAIVMDSGSKRILLIKHRKLKRWLQAGGHGEGETNPADIALRETSEETNLADLHFFPPNTSPLPLDIDVHTIPANQDIPAHEHLDFRYLIVTTSPNSLSGNTLETLDARWFTYAETLALEMDAQLKRLIKKAYDCYLGTSSPT